MLLYHFTSVDNLPGIKKHGLFRGDVPTSPTDGYQAPWLTSNPCWHKQLWSKGSSVNKTQVRLTITLPDEDERLRFWPSLAKEIGIKNWWYKALDRAGGRGSRFWYVYHGVIPWEAITAAEERP